MRMLRRDCMHMFWRSSIRLIIEVHSALACTVPQVAHELFRSAWYQFSFCIQHCYGRAGQWLMLNRVQWLMARGTEEPCFRTELGTAKFTRRVGTIFQESCMLWLLCVVSVSSAHISHHVARLKLQLRRAQLCFAL